MLITRITKGLNHGKESRKFIWDCTICHPCRYGTFPYVRPETAGLPHPNGRSSDGSSPLPSVAVTGSPTSAPAAEFSATSRSYASAPKRRRQVRIRHRHRRALGPLARPEAVGVGETPRAATCPGRPRPAYRSASARPRCSSTPKSRRPSAATGSSASVTRTVTEVLDGVTGVTLVPNRRRAVGMGYYLRVRGAKSVSFNRHPVVFIDGVRVEPLGYDGGMGALVLIDPGTIECSRARRRAPSTGPTRPTALC